MDSQCPAATTSTATRTMEAACPDVMGSMERQMARSLFCWRPRASAKSQPMPGFNPW
jgi:hypothetical protein